MNAEKKNKVLLFYNAHSGSGTFKNNLDYVIGKFQEKGLQVVPLRASKGRTLGETLAEIDQDEYRQIIVSGGDGTINVCVNHMIKNDIHLPLAIFPAGTANDFAYNFGIPTDIREMVDIALGDKLVEADVGQVNDKYFINVAAIGSLVDVSQKTDPRLKNTLGTMAYYLKGISEVPALKPLPMKFVTDDKVFDEKIYFMVVMNGKSAGGFKKLALDSSINDGLLDVMIFKKMNVVELATTTLKVLRGRHIGDKNIDFFQTRKLRLETNANVSTDIDGEEGGGFPMDFSVLKSRLKIFVAPDVMPADPSIELTAIEDDEYMIDEGLSLTDPETKLD